MATLKTCFKCGAEKPRTEFYKHPQMGDGLLGKCKTCTKRDVTEHRIANVEMIREYDRQRANLPHRAAQRKEIFKRWELENPHKKRAQQKLRRAIEAGTVERLPCWVCGNPKSEGHHPDYSAPLDVVWLCRVHHMEIHGKIRNVA